MPHDRLAEDAAAATRQEVIKVRSRRIIACKQLVPSLGHDLVRGLCAMANVTTAGLNNRDDGLRNDRNSNRTRGNSAGVFAADRQLMISQNLANTVVRVVDADAAVAVAADVEVHHAMTDTATLALGTFRVVNILAISDSLHQRPGETSCSRMGRRRWKC